MTAIGINIDPKFNFKISSHVTCGHLAVTPVSYGSSITYN